MNKNVEFLTLILARGGSKGIPRKNLALLGGKPLIEFTINTAIKAQIPGRVCLSTDDQEIIDCAGKFDIEIPFVRPKRLAQDDTVAIDVMTHAIEWYEKSESFFPEYILLLQPTCPFRTVENIKKSTKLIIEKNADSLISVNRVHEHPCDFLIPDKHGFEYVMPPPKRYARQNFQKVYYLNGSIYISRISWLKKENKIYSTDAILFETGRYESIDIDDLDDLLFANWVIDSNKI